LWGRRLRRRRGFREAPNLYEHDDGEKNAKVQNGTKVEIRDEFV
jgi:hypothetical protein